MQRFEVPEEVVTATLRVLQAAGRKQREAFVVWGGKVDAAGDTLRFTTVEVPAQLSHATAHGLLVTVTGEALHELNRSFYRRDELLAAQVHSHPTAAYHSDTDDRYPLVTLRGALSGVVPDFAAGGAADLGSWAWYRLLDRATWRRVDSRRLLVYEGC